MFLFFEEFILEDFVLFLKLERFLVKFLDDCVESF